MFHYLGRVQAMIGQFTWHRNRSENLFLILHSPVASLTYIVRWDRWPLDHRFVPFGCGLVVYSALPHVFHPPTGVIRGVTYAWLEGTFKVLVGVGSWRSPRLGSQVMWQLMLQLCPVKTRNSNTWGEWVDSSRKLQLNTAIRLGSTTRYSNFHLFNISPPG